MSSPQELRYVIKPDSSPAEPGSRQESKPRTGFDRGFLSGQPFYTVTPRQAVTELKPEVLEL